MWRGRLIRLIEPRARSDPLGALPPDPRHIFKKKNYRTPDPNIRHPANQRVTVVIVQSAANV